MIFRRWDLDNRFQWRPTGQKEVTVQYKNTEISRNFFKIKTIQPAQLIFLRHNYLQLPCPCGLCN
jgi:hypothetical protein